MAERILIAEGDERLEFVLRETLVRRGCEVDVVPRAAAMIDRLAACTYDAILLDVRLPDIGRLDALSKCRELAPDTPVVVVTPPGARSIALEAIHRGAYDFFTTPLQMSEFEIVVARALERRRLLCQIKALHPRRAPGWDDLVGECAELRRAIELARGAAPTDLPVLVEGESGTGKALLARAIHQHSARRDGPLVFVNAAATPGCVLESRLFGCERAAPMAARSQPGRFEQAHTGTLVLDDIDAVPPAIQAKILRVLVEGRIERVGGAKRIPVDVRLVASTRRPLDALVASGQFCGALLSRLRQVELLLPPLRERIDDLPLLLAHLAERAARWSSWPPPAVSPEAMRCLSSYAWPGNVHELWEVLQAAIALSDGAIRPEHLPPAIQRSSGGAPRSHSLGSLASGSLDEMLAEDERRMIVAALRSAGGVQARAAKRLGISERSLWYRVKKLRIPTRPDGVDARS